MEKDGIITNALYAKFANEVRQIQEEILLKQVMSDSSYTGTINDLLKSESDYNKKLIIQEGNLVYVANEVSSQETKWLESLGIEQSSDYFTVEFDSAGGTEIGSQTIKTGTLVKKPSNPKKEGHDFLGWYYLKQSGSADNPTYTEIKFDFDTKITSNYSLYAKYSGEAIIHACGRNFAFWKSEYKTKITNISFEKKEIIIPDTAVESWDVRADNNCAAVTAYVEPDDDGTGYNLKIISPHTIYAHPNSAGYFQDFTNLQNINFDNFDTSKAISMSAMFQSCSKIESLDLSNFSTTNVNNMSYMFCGCAKIEKLDLSSFDMSQVTNTNLMFFRCYKLNELNLKNWKVSNLEKVTSTSRMFESVPNSVYVYVDNNDMKNWILNIKSSFVNIKVNEL